MVFHKFQQSTYASPRHSDMPPKIQVLDLDTDSQSYSPGPRSADHRPAEMRQYRRSSTSSTFNYKQDLARRIHETTDSARCSPDLRAMENAHSAFLKATENLKMDLGSRHTWSGSWCSSPTAYSSSSPKIPSFRVALTPTSPEVNLHTPPLLPVVCRSAVARESVTAFSRMTQVDGTVH